MKLRNAWRAVAAVGIVSTTALPVAVPAQDEEPLSWYAVEIIVFERIGDTGRNAEAWPTDPGLPRLADALELSVEGMALEDLESGGGAGAAPDAPADGAAPQTELAAAPETLMPRAFQLIPPEELRLADAWTSLERSSAYRPLLHLGWIQPGFPAEQARLVHVRNDNAALGAVTGRVNGDDAGGVPLEAGSGGAPSLASRIEIARDRSRVALDGTVRVHRARYLHVQADLLYYRPVDGDSPAPPTAADSAALPAPDSPDTAFIEQLLAEDDATPRLFRLTESRRMRSRELHYLDHPLFGVLLEAWPVELPEPPAAPLTGEPETPEGDAAQPAPLPAPAPSGSGG